MPDFPAERKQIVAQRRKSSIILARKARGEAMVVKKIPDRLFVPIRTRHHRPLTDSDVGRRE